MTVVAIALPLLTLLAFVDAYRHDEDAWSAAERDRRWWLLVLGVSLVLVLPGVIFMPAYLVGVRPRFGLAMPTDFLK